MPREGSLAKKFKREEIGARIQCSIHGWMGAYICIVDHPFFAVTGDDGSFSLGALPPGKYTITVWHERLGTQSQEVTLEEGKAATVDFTFAAK